MIDDGTRLSLHCFTYLCHHSAMLDLCDLRERLGPDHGTMHDDLVPLFRCSTCGGKNLGLILHVDTRPQAMRRYLASLAGPLVVQSCAADRLAPL